MEFRGDINEQSLTRLANTLDLDVEKIFAQMQTPAVAQIIGRNRTLGNDMSISGTPTFVIETELVRGYIPFDQMAALVREIRGSTPPPDHSRRNQ